jgi:hypothetical protein
LPWPTSDPGDHATSVALALDEAGEAQLRQVLAGHGRLPPGGGGEGGRIGADQDRPIIDNLS